MDMSECMEQHSVSRLIGAPPGYVGYEDGGFLTEKVRRRPYSVVLFDEIEKAHPEVCNLLLQIMDEGRLTDARGRRADFRNCIVIMTGNVGARHFSEDRPPLGFGGAEIPGAEGRRRAEAELKRTFRPEFLGRVDETVWFRRLERADVREIARRMLQIAAERAAAAGVTLRFTDAAAEYLAERGCDPASGARPLRGLIRTLVEDPAAEQLLRGALNPGDTALLDVRGGALGIGKTGGKTE
jgi:ATP-dependent Clp protease ATP-binding subunit ClpC